jgi:hypothetical protein
MFITDADFMCRVYELGKKHGKKPGDSLQEEFEELLKVDPGAVQFIGHTDQDVDMLTGNLREQGVKVTSIKEVDRRKGA